jgi:hypothetical protein
VTTGEDDSIAPQSDGVIDLPPQVARRLLEASEREGLGAGAWISAFALRRLLLVRAARDGDVCEFERQFRALRDVRDRCRREGLGGGGERRAQWQLVRADLRDGCAVLSQDGLWPSAPILRSALRIALADRLGSGLVPALLGAASRQVMIAGDQLGARRLLRFLEDDLCVNEPVLVSVNDGLDQCIECAQQIAARFGPDAPRAAVVQALGGGWMLHGSAARALEVVDSLLVRPSGASRPGRDSHAMALAVGARAWHVLGDVRESARLLHLAHAAIGRGFRRRWSGRRACAESIAWVAAARD